MSKEISRVEPKLSISAQFDDLCRFSNYMISSNEELEVLRVVIKNQEENRKEWFSTKEEFMKLEEENRNLKSTLSKIKTDLSKTNRKKANFKSLSLQLRKRLDSIKKFIEDNIKFCRCDPNKEQLFSYFEPNFVLEEIESDSEEYSSLDDESLWKETNEETDNMMLELGMLFNEIDVID